MRSRRWMNVERSEANNNRNERKVAGAARVMIKEGCRNDEREIVVGGGLGGVFESRWQTCSAAPARRSVRDQGQRMPSNAVPRGQATGQWTAWRASLEPVRAPLSDLSRLCQGLCTASNHEMVPVKITLSITTAGKKNPGRLAVQGAGWSLWTLLFSLQKKHHLRLFRSICQTL